MITSQQTIDTTKSHDITIIEKITPSKLKIIFPFFQFLILFK